VSGGRAAISVVIPTRNRPTWLRKCLDALLPLLQADDEVIVVDSASTTSDTAEVAQQAGVRLVTAPRPGSSLARNLGWQAARHDLIAFVDDDVTVLPGWPDAVAAALGRADVEWMTGWIGVPPDQLHLPEPNPVMLSVEPRVLDRDCTGALGASANCGFRRSALVQSGGFDERFGPGTWVAAGEDQELFDRLVLDNCRGYYEPAARVYHDQWRTRRQSLRLHWNYGKGMGARLARLWRNDRALARRTGREVIVGDTLTSFVRALRAGYQTGAVFALLRLAGTVAVFMVRVWRP
jgi:glycosyltransferase involved in cell wall biosynthesis